MATLVFCTVFGHKFSEWEWVDGSCKVTRICKRDDATETTVKHDYSEWRSDGQDYFRAIREFRVCRRCGCNEEQMRGKPYSQYTTAEAQELSKAEYADYMDEVHHWSKPT
jgi:hypothetical protein